MANKVYLLLPAVGTTKHPSYIKTIDEAQALDLAGRLLGTLMMIEHEDYIGYYDKVLLGAFIKCIQQKDQKKADDIRESLRRWYATSDSQIDDTFIKGEKVVDSVTKCYLADTSDSKIMMSLAAIDIDQENNIRLGKSDYSTKKVIVKPVNMANAYLWFVDNRNPQRDSDPEYKKHTNKTRIGRKGKLISACHYDVQDIKAHLREAIGLSKGSAKTWLLFQLTDEETILKFMNENTAMYYHAYEFGIDNEAELNKVAKHNVRLIKKKMCFAEQILKKYGRL